MEYVQCVGCIYDHPHLCCLCKKLTYNYHKVVGQVIKDSIKILPICFECEDRLNKDDD